MAKLCAEMTQEELGAREQEEFNVGPLSIPNNSVKNKLRPLSTVEAIRNFSEELSLLTDIATWSEMWTEQPKTGKGKKEKALSKDCFTSNIFLRGDLVILLLKKPLAPPEWFFFDSCLIFIAGYLDGSWGCRSCSHSRLMLTVEGQIRSKHKVVFDNTPTTAHLATGSPPIHRKVKNISKTSKKTVKDAFAHQGKPLIECKSEIDDDYPAATAQLASESQPYKKVRKARKEMLRDASTFTDRGAKEILQDASTFTDKQPVRVC
ncbi:unnamed protein product [Haemonchus placei]|uniref:snRNP core protein D2 n=1 Tax=Haemonchus placei TaxID=6290 RepID=A0A0N4X6L0_HAEPC|nr:unnamed protein product [Haemonchus placei]